MGLNPTPLTGDGVRLEPLGESHREPLRLLAEDPQIWAFTLIRPTGADFDPWFEEMLQENSAGTRVMFAVRLVGDDRLVGCTSLFDYSAKNRVVEIGSTWYHPDYWSTPVNPECKLLLLTHAFEVMGMNRVQLVTDLLNTRSQAAIAKLGAQREGVLRSHKITHTGRVRDTVVFSIIASEWPSVRDRLRERLAKVRG
jgi:N-acetyltransferase